MAITFSGSTGNLFNRWGKMLGGANEAQGVVNATLSARVTSILAQFASADGQVLQQNANNLLNMQGQYQTTPQALLTSYTSMMQNTLVAMAVDDFAANGNNNGGGVLSTNPTFLQCLTYAINQMNSGGYANTAWLQRPTLASSITANAANVGNGTLVCSTTDWDGRPLDYLLSETLTVTCTADGYPGGTGTTGSETFSSTGQNAASSINAWNYGNAGVGSGSTIGLTVLDTTKTSGLVLTDGNFESWSGTTPNFTPTSWNIGVGSIGSSGTVQRGNTPYLGTYDLWIIGDGSELTTIRQAVTLAPNTVYAVNAYMHTDGAVAAGALAMRLVTAATPTAPSSSVVNNDAGVANSIAVDVTALTSSFAAVSGTFQTPAVLPATVYFEIHVSTAITNTEKLNVDCVGIQEATQQYPGGPWQALFTGSTDFAAGDSFTNAVSSTQAGSVGFVVAFPSQLGRYLQLATLNGNAGVKFPSSTSTSSGEVHNNIIT